MRVYKYPLALLERQGVSMPDGALILHLDVQHDTITLWAAVDPEKPLQQRLFVLAGTGHELPGRLVPRPDTTTGVLWAAANDLAHIGTVLMNDYVWHVFEVIG